jgi:hypothetical protein
MTTSRSLKFAAFADQNGPRDQFARSAVAAHPLQLQQDIAPKTGLKSVVANGYVF